MPEGGALGGRQTAHGDPDLGHRRASTGGRIMESEEILRSIHVIPSADVAHSLN